MKDSFADKVRKVYQKLGANGRPVSNTELSLALDLPCHDHKEPMYVAIKDLRDSGEIVQTGKGLHMYKGKEKKPEIREIMWRVLRARHTVATNDLIELTGANAEYAGEWLRMLKRRGVVRRNKKRSDGTYTWTMIKDTVAMPEDTEKVAKLRNLRRQKKDEALAALDAAYIAIVRARMSVAEIDTPPAQAED